MAEEKGQPLRFTLTHCPGPQHTHEDFIQWIVEDYLPLAMPIFKKHGGVLGYTLVSDLQMLDKNSVNIGLLH